MIVKKIPPARDLYLNEIPSGTHRIRCMATIVDITNQTLTLNDGTGQITINLAEYNHEEFTITKFYRWIISVTKTNEKQVGYLIAFDNITKSQAKQYKRLVKLERRVAK